MYINIYVYIYIYIYQLNIAQMSSECSIEKLERNIRSDKSTQEICQAKPINMPICQAS